jgi:general secretion pathway protein H
MRLENDCDKGRDAGFSLLETLVVFVILGLALSTLAVAMRQGRATSTTAMRTEVLTLLATARSKAILESRPATVEIDVRGKTLGLKGAEKTFELPLGFELSATVGQETIRHDALGAILFLPDGTSSGGQIVLQDTARNRRVTIVTNWLTGISTESANAE